MLHAKTAPVKGRRQLEDGSFVANGRAARPYRLVSDDGRVIAYHTRPHELLELADPGYTIERCDSVQGAKWATKRRIEERVKERREKVMALVCASVDGVTISDLMPSVRMAERTLRDDLVSLLEAGGIRREQRGRFVFWSAP